jgi:hypothetical protein
MEYGKVAAQVAAEASMAARQSKKACGSGYQERAQPALQYCGNCSSTGHNARMCKKDIEGFSEPDASTMYVGSLFDSDEIEELQRELVLPSFPDRLNGGIRYTKSLLQR